eukprot:5794842-Pleurochrysis_carterae.AAC.1
MRNASLSAACVASISTCSLCLDSLHALCNGRPFNPSGIRCSTHELNPFFSCRFPARSSNLLISEPQRIPLSSVTPPHQDFDMHASLASSRAACRTLQRCCLPLESNKSTSLRLLQHDGAPIPLPTSPTAAIKIRSSMCKPATQLSPPHGYTGYASLVLLRAVQILSAQAVCILVCGTANSIAPSVLHSLALLAG